MDKPLLHRLWTGSDPLLHTYETAEHAPRQRQHLQIREWVNCEKINRRPSHLNLDINICFICSQLIRPFLLPMSLMTSSNYLSDNGSPSTVISLRSCFKSKSIRSPAKPLIVSASSSASPLRSFTIEYIYSNFTRSNRYYTLNCSTSRFMPKLDITSPSDLSSGPRFSLESSLSFS
jgi:hypothetical protein